MALPHTDGEITLPMLRCMGFPPQPELVFTGSFGPGVVVKIGDLGQATITREEIAALAALFPVQHKFHTAL